jgi:hypothetical protein
LGGTWRWLCSAAVSSIRSRRFVTTCRVPGRPRHPGRLTWSNCSEGCRQYAAALSAPRPTDGPILNMTPYPDHRNQGPTSSARDGPPPSVTCTHVERAIRVDRWVSGCVAVSLRCQPNPQGRGLVDAGKYANKAVVLEALDRGKASEDPAQVNSAQPILSGYRLTQARDSQV